MQYVLCDVFLVIDDVLLRFMAHDCGRDMRPALDIVGGHHYDCTEIRKEQENKTYEKSSQKEKEVNGKKS